MGDFFTAKSDEFFGIEVDAFDEFHCRFYRFAEFRIRDAEYGCVLHGGMCE